MYAKALMLAVEMLMLEGVYSGDTPEQAFDQIISDASAEMAAESVKTMAKDVAKGERVSWLEANKEMLASQPEDEDE